MMIICPRCNSLSTIPIVYGKPSYELAAAASRGLVETAGCVIGENDPTRRCLDCSHGWGTLNATHDQNENAQESLREVKAIVENYLHPIYMGMVSSDLFDECPKGFGAVDSYLRLKEVLGITRGCSKAQIDSVRTFQKLHPEDFNRIISELKYQICTLSLSNRWPGSLYNATFTAAALVFNASPMCYGEPDPEHLSEFESSIRSGWIGFE